MTEVCNCITAVKRALISARLEAKKTEYENGQNLEQFKDSITDGATERISRTLFKAGAYQTCILRNMKKDFSPKDIVQTLEFRTSSNNDSEHINLSNFIIRNSQKIIEQEKYINIEELLRRILSNKKRAEGLLKINYEREIGYALSSLRRLDKLKLQLDTWKMNARLQEKVQYVAIVDMHYKTI